MSGLIKKKEHLEQAGSAVSGLLLPYTDPREPRILPYSGQPFWTLNTMRPGGGMRQRVYRLDQLEFVLNNIANDTDTYVSQALFSRPCRRAVHVQWLTHSYIDLDLYKLPTPPNPGAAGIAIRTFCRDEGLPEPSLIISSGRGIYLKYLWSSPVPRQATGRFVSVNRRLAARFQDWGSDPAAVDVSRVLRVVGTTNSKNGARTAIIHQAERDGQVLTYNFDQFADEVLPYTAAEYREIKAARTAKAELRILSHERARRAARERAVEGRVGNQRGFDREDWHWNVLEDLRTLAALRYQDGVVPEGWRAVFGHVGACQLAMVAEADQLWHEVHAWSRILLPENYRETPQFKSDCSTLLRNAQRAKRGELVEWNGRKVTPIYTYKAETLIELLQITGGEMRQMTRLIDNDEKQRRRREIWRAEHTGLSREEYLTENTISRDRPWEKEGLSRRQWYRDQKLE